MELDTAPTETTYIPGHPGAAWTPEEVTVTRQRILEMLRPELDTQKINFGDLNLILVFLLFNILLFR